MVIPASSWNVPAAVAWQTDCPKEPWYHPFGQYWHVLECVRPVWVLYLPLPQDAHLVFPAAAWNFPFGHVLHLVRPVCVWYVPAAQLAHDAAPDDAVAYVPAAQTAHALCPAAPCVDHPEGQAVHAAALVRPVCAWYLPAAQGVHDVALGS